jgi:hypothetical protein
MARRGREGIGGARRAGSGMRPTKLLLSALVPLDAKKMLSALVH